MMPGANAASSAANPLHGNVFSDIYEWGQEAPTMLDALYSSPFAVHCIFRSLPPLARLYVTRLLYVNPKDPSSITIDSFASSLRRRKRAEDRHNLACRALTAFRILLERDNGVLFLNSAFAAQLRVMLAGQMPAPFSGPINDPASGRVPSEEELDHFSAKRLERILNYLVEPDGSDVPSDSVLRALVHMGILDERRDGLIISSAGFQFLLKDAYSQVWVLLRSVLKEHYGSNEMHVLNFVFQLSFAKTGQLYVDNDLNLSQASILMTLDDLGVIKLDENNTFRPTSTGVGLLAAASRIQSSSVTHSAMSRRKSSISAAGDVRIVVETNFRVFAYTTSAFQMNLLGLFTSLRYRLPNLVVCHLTRDAVRVALVNGISADQIIAYLNAHADQRMLKGVIPSNVRDEIRLWEAEQQRVQFKPSVMLEFNSLQDMHHVIELADKLGARLYLNEHRAFIIVTRDAYERGGIKRLLQSAR